MPTKESGTSAAIAESDFRATDAEGTRYRSGVFIPLDEASLPAAPDAPEFPVRGHGPAYRVHNEVPKVPRVRHLIGPSVIALGMGLGAGEMLLWPNLITVNGYQIWWLFWVGVLTQFVVISEIERWTIATGESVFRGMARLTRVAFWPWFFLLATLFGFFWPGWASQSAEFIGEIILAVTGESIGWQPIALLMLAFCWLALAASKIVYNALERLEMGMVFGFFPLLAVSLFIVGVVPDHVLDLLKGAVSIGRAPQALLTGAQFPTLLIAVAYAGSGGTLLLCQSLWIRDKGFGMSAYQGRIAGIRGKNENLSDSGYVFDARNAPTALARFRAWMRVSEQELLVTFVLLILLSVVITSLLVTSTLGMNNTAMAGDLSGMMQQQSDALYAAGGVWLRIAFLLGGAFVLFSTQLGIVDTVTRICGTVFYEQYGRRTTFWTLKRTFLFFLTLFVLASMAIVLFSWSGGETVDRLQPNFLVLVAGPATIASMYFFAMVVGYMNVRRLPEDLRMPTWKRWGCVWAAVLWGWFTVEALSRQRLTAIGAPQEMIESIQWHPVRGVLYGIWIVSILWFVWSILGPGARQKR